MTFSVNIESMREKRRCPLWNFAQKKKRELVLRSGSQTLAKKCMEHPLTRLACRQTLQKFNACDIVICQPILAFV